MTAIRELIDLLATIGQRDDGLGVIARAHVRRLERPKQSQRAQEERLSELQGFVELVLELELLDYGTASRLSKLASAAWRDVLEGGAGHV